MATLIRWISLSFFKYYVPIVGSLFLLCFLSGIEVAGYLAIIIVLLGEGLVFNQILRVPGLVSQLIITSHNITSFWIYSNIILMVIFNLAFILATALFDSWTNLSHGLVAFNFYLLPLLIVGNYISNSRIAFAYAIFGIPVLRLGLYYLVLSCLMVLHALVGDMIYLAVTLAAFLILYFVTLPKKDVIGFSSEFYALDKSSYV